MGESKPQRRAPAPLKVSGIDGVLGYQLALAAIVTTNLFMDEVGTRENLRKVEFTILQLIAQNPSITSAQLARALAISTPGTKSWIDLLEGKGLIRRERGNADRRAQHLHATHKGLQVANRALARLLDADRSRLQISNAEHAILIELLQRVASSR